MRRKAGRADRDRVTRVTILFITSLAPGIMMFKRLALFLVLVPLVPARPVSAQWKPTNGPYGGLIYCFLADGSTLYAGSNGRVYRSTDSGAHWTCSGIAPAKSDIVHGLASNGSALFATSDYIYRSTDSGKTWTRSSNGLPPSYAMTLYAVATIGPTVFVGTSIGLLRSTNNGDTWDSLGIGKVTALWAKGNIMLASGDHEEVSLDGGAHWTQVASRPQLAAVSCYANIGSTLFFGSDGDWMGTGGGVARSTDNGNNWTLMNGKLGVLSLCSIGTTLIAADTGVHYSTDNGATWTRAEGIPNSAYAKAVTTMGGSVYAGMDGAGVYRSTDEGRHWFPCNTGLANVNVLTLAVSGPYLCLGSASSGFFRTSDQGASWSDPVSKTTFFGDMNTIYSLAQLNTSLFAGVQMTGYDYCSGHGVYRSDDNGSTWTEVGNGLSGTAFLSVFADGYRILAGSFGLGKNGVEHPGLFSSVDHGANWSKEYTVGESSDVAAILTLNNSIYIGTPEGVASNRFGWHLSPVGNAIVHYNVSALASMGTTLIAGLGGTAYTYRSTDYGSTWQPAENGWHSYDHVYSFATRDRYLFAATTDGVYYSTDTARTWTSAGLKGLYVRSLLFVGDELYAGLIGDVVYHASFNDLVAQRRVQNDAPAGFQLEVFPDPCSTSAQITFDPGTSGHADVSILSMVGVEVAHLFSGELEAGEHEFTWQPQRVPDGVYQCVVKMDGRVQTRRVVLLH